MIKNLLPVLLILILPGKIIGQDIIRLKVSDFDSVSAYAQKDSTWTMMEVESDNLTNYSSITDEDGNKVIKAVSNNAAGGLIYNIKIDSNEYPIIEWRWKVDDVLEKGDLSKKEGDDYPARIYLIFDYEASNLSMIDRIKLTVMQTFTSHDIPLRSLNYIWANKVKVGTVAPNPFTDWVYMIAVESGNQKAGRWITETKNIPENYRKVFGEEPPEIVGVAIMTDTDNTGEQAVAYYGDIIFKTSPSDN